MRAFVEAAHVGRHGVVLPSFDKLTNAPEFIDAESDAKFGFVKYGWSGTTTYMDARTGFVAAYTSDDSDETKLPYDRGAVDRLVPRKVSDAEAVELARGFHEAARLPYGLQPFNVRDHRGDHGNRISVSFTPTWRGVPLDRDFAGYVELDRNDGRLRTYLLHALAFPLPKPPTSLVPQVSAKAARLAALRAALGRWGENLTEDPQWPFALCVACPVTPTGGETCSFLDPAQARWVAQGGGLLVYTGQLHDAQGGPAANVRVDALTGRVLHIEGLRYGRGGATPAKTLAPLTTSRAWRIASGGGDWSAPAWAALTPDTAALGTGAPVLMTDGTTGLSATYDAKANLLGIAGKAYRPGPALAALLKRRLR